jgi:hypothetical protein
MNTDTEHKADCSSATHKCEYSNALPEQALLVGPIFNSDIFYWQKISDLADY